MILHSPIISGSLTFADNATFNLPDGGEFSGSFSGSLQIEKVKSDLIPDTSGAYDLGSEAYPYKDLWLVGSTLNLGGIGISVGTATGGLSFKKKSDNTPAAIGAKSISIGGIGVTGNKKFGLDAQNKVQVLDDNDDVDTIIVKDIVLKDTTGNGKNTKLKVTGGKFTTSQVNNAGADTAADAEGALSGSFTGSIKDASFNGDATFNNGMAVTGTSTLGVTNVSGLASLDGGVDVDGAFTVADSTGNVATTGTLGVTGTSTLGVINASGLLSADAGIDVDGVFTVADSTGNVSTTGTLGAGNTTISGTVGATGLASLDGGIDVDGVFTVADSSGNVATTGTLSAGNTTVGTLGSSGLASLDGGIDVDSAFTVANTSGNVATTGTLGVSGTSTLGVVNASGLISADGGLDVDGAFTVADSSGNVVTTGTLASGQQTVTGHILPGAHNTYDLGSSTLFWRDLYLSSGSLYINGQQVLSTDGTDLTVQTDAGESLKLLETGADTITLQTENGDITLTNGSGTGNIELDAPIQITAGNNILSSDGNAIAFANDISAGSNRISSNNMGNVAGTSTITGSFVGDGSGLTGLATILTVDDASSTQNLDLIADDLQFLGTANEIETAVTKVSTDVKVTIGLPSDVTIGNDLTVSNDLGVSGNAVITGNLTVSGTTTTVNSNTVNIGDNQIVLNSDETGTPTQNGGIAIERGTSTNSSLIWNETNDYWMSGLLGAEERIVVGVGNTDITTLGTIVTGVWNGTAITHDYIGLDAIDGTNIADDSIESEHYADLSIDTGHIAADAVTGAKIADDSINSEHIVDGSVDRVHLAADIVNGTKIADNAIDSEHYTDGSIDTAHIGDLQVTGGKIANDAIGGTKIADDSIDSEHIVDGSVDTAHIADLNITTGKIAADAVTGAKIADATIDSEHYALGSVDNNHLSADSVDGTKIADDSINSEHYVDGSIDTAHIGDLQVTGGKIAADAITAAKIADNAINSEHYVDGSVDNAHLAGSIDVSKITELSNLTSDEGTQLENIDSVTITNTQWGYLGASNQGVATSNSVNFAGITASGLLTVNGTGTSEFTSHLKSHCLGVGVNASGVSGEIHAGADIVAYASSDERLKENIKPIENPIGKIAKISGNTFDWIENSDIHSHKGSDIGVIAQEIEAVLPELVTTRENGYKAVKYDKVVALLIEAVKEQQSQIDELKSKLS